MSDCELAIRRDELVRALKPFIRLLRKDTRQEAILAPADDGMEIVLGGITVTVPGEGAWTRRIRIPGYYFTRIARYLPPGDPVELEVVEDRCRVGPVWLPCQAWPDVWDHVGLPINPALPDILAIHQQHSPMAIEHSGLGREVKAVVDLRDKLIERALKILAPLGVTRSDVRWTIERAVSRHASRAERHGQIALFDPARGKPSPPPDSEPDA